MKKILLSLGVIVFVAAAVASGTGAFFSDTERSAGNTLAAGAIDLGIDNESYYNGEFNEGTSWDLDFDLDDTETPRLFFNFDDLKPGDYGEDTISVHVTNNESWLCADVTLTRNADNTCVEPEEDDEGAGVCGTGDANTNGDLAQQINFLWWADDGDNVLEDDEQVLPAGALGALGVGNTATVALADSDENIWGEDGGVLTPEDDDIRYVGKAWCFGDIAAAPLDQDDATDARNPSMDNNNNTEAGEAEDGGFTCTGASVIDNSAQTDVAMLDVAFRAVQARNNDDFQCGTPDNGGDDIEVGAGSVAYAAPTCAVTVSGDAAIQDALDDAAANSVVCVDATYTGVGDSAASRMETAGVTLAATTQGVTLFHPVVLSADNVTVTGFDGVIGQAESGAEQAAFYLDNDATNATISHNTVSGGTGAAILTETGASLGGGLIANNVLSGATQGIYLNPHTGSITIEYNDIDNNAAGIGGLNGAVVRYNEFGHTTPGSEAIGIDETFEANPAVINFNNFLDDMEINTYDTSFAGTVTSVIDAKHNFFSTSGTSQTDDSAGGTINFTPQAAAAYPHS